MTHPFFARCFTVALLFTFCINNYSIKAQSQKKKFTVIAYYPGNASEIDKYPVEMLTHIIFSFVHLRGNELTIDQPSDSITIRHLVDLKKRNSALKIILSLGGWGGCQTCSSVFSNPESRLQFVNSAKHVLQAYAADGLDLDWEFPAIEGFPGHLYTSNDRQNFTSLFGELRKTFGSTYEISFASGGFSEYLSKSVEWEKVMPLVDRVNLMTYDLTNGFSKVTGHHTPLYSSPSQKESVDFAIRFLDSIGVPINKIAIGAAFYARVWENVQDINNGLYQSGKFKTGVDFKNFTSYFTPENGFEYHWDNVCQAPYYYSRKQQLFGTFDDIHSVTLKTEYAILHHLDGMMFWELTGDTYKNGLLDAILNTINKNQN